MLTLTETASTAVRSIVGQTPSTETGGLRIATAAGTPETEFQVTLAAEPEVTDAVIERDGARIFVETTAALALDDKVLDAEIDEDGSVRFALTAQA